MKFTALEKRLAKLEAATVPPGGEWLRIVIHEDDNEEEKARKQQEAVAKHVASHSENAGLAVEDFNWIVRILFRPRVLMDG